MTSASPAFLYRRCLTYDPMRFVALVLSLLLTSVAQAQDSSSSPDDPAGQPTKDAVTDPSAKEASENSDEASDKAEVANKADGSTDEVKEDGESEETTEDEKPPEPEVVPPFKSLPYSVKVTVAFASGCLPSRPQQERVTQSIRHAITRMYGRMWDTEVELNDWMVPAERRHLEWLTTEEMLLRYPESEVHKAFLVTVEMSGSAYAVSCREFDSRIHEFTPIVSRISHDDRAIGTVTAELLRDVFRPCVLYLQGYQDQNGRPMMELQVQAGEIIPPDPTAEQVVEDDVLRPFVRQMDRREPTKLERLRRLDLSYIRVMEIDRGDASETESTSESLDPNAPVFVPLEPEQTEEASVEDKAVGGHSPGRIQGFYITHHPMSPFGAKGRRLQHFAVRQRPTADQSKVRIVLRGRPDKPLVSHRLALAYQLHWKDPEDGSQLPLVSDRNGDVIIDQKEGHPTFWIRVYSGRSLLARVPYAPGLIPFDTIELPDDSIRLGVEGEIQLLADELVDAIALQAVLMARARKATENGDVAGLQSLLDRLEKVPGKDEFLKSIENIWIPAKKKCDERRLPSVFSRRLCDSLRDTVNRFFSDEKVGEHLRDISIMKATAAKNAAAN